MDAKLLVTAEEGTDDGADYASASDATTPLGQTVKDEEATAGIFGTSMNVVVQVMGIGITSLSFMLKQGGWSCLVLMIGCAVAANYSGKLLIACCYDEGGVRVNESYGDIGFAAFGKCGRFTTRLFENITFFGISALFLILAGDFLSELPVEMNPRIWTLASAAIVCVPVLLFPNIAELRFVSVIGVAAVIVVAFAVLFLAGLANNNDDSGGGHAGNTTTFANSGGMMTSSRWSHSTDVIIPLGFLSSFSSMTLAFGCHAGLPAVEQSMKNPKRFGTMFNIAFAIVLSLYIPVAIVGYAKYGDEVQSPILLSLPSGSWVQVLAKGMLCTHVLLAYPILMMFFVREIEHWLNVNRAASSSVTRYVLKRTGIRVISIVLNVTVAILAPYFSDMMGLIGALGSVMTTFVLPCLFFLKLKTMSGSSSQKCGAWILPLCVGVVGTIGGAVGALEATISLVQKIAARGNPWQ